MIDRNTTLEELRAHVRASRPYIAPGNVVTDNMARSVQQSLRAAGHAMLLDDVHAAARRVLSRHS